MSEIYRERRDAFLEALQPLGYPVETPRATIYVWLPISRASRDALAFTAEVLERAGVVVTPGSGFGAAGEGYVRVSLCDDVTRLREAGQRMAKAGLPY